MFSSVPRRAYRAIRNLSNNEPPSLPSTLEHDAQQPLQLTPIDQVERSVAVSGGERIQIIVESVNTDPEQEGAALLQFVFKDSQGIHCAIEDWPHVSARVGEYIYLNSQLPGGAALTVAELRAPENSTRLEIIGHRWKNSVNTSIIDDLIINTDQAEPVLETSLGTTVKVQANHFKQRIALNGTQCVTLSVRTQGSPKGGSAPLRVAQHDSDGNELMPISSLQQNENIGPILLLKTKPDQHSNEKFSFTVDNRASSIEITGVDWGEKTPYIVGPIEAVEQSTTDQNPREFIANVPSDTPLYLIDTTAPPLGHETLALRPNNLAAEYASLGKAVVFLPFGSLQGYPESPGKNLYQIQRSQVDALVDLLIDARSDLANYYICSSFPSLQSVTIAARLKAAGWRIIYEVRDDMEEFNRVGYSKWYHPRLETEMIRLSDEIVTVSAALADKVTSLSPNYGDTQVHVLPNGVNTEVIEQSRQLRTAEIAELRKESTTIGYVGHLTPSWFDWQLLTTAAKLRPHLKFQIIGHGAPAGLRLPANVDLLGPRTHAEIIQLIDEWKVGIIPFVHSPLTRSVDPNKIYEYFAWGLRCVTAEMGMVQDYPSTWVYNSVDEFCEAIDEATATPMDSHELQILDSFVAQSSWNNRATAMIELIEGTD